MFAVRSVAPLRGYAPSLPASPLSAVRFRFVAPASFGRRFRNLASVLHTPPAPALWGSLPRLASSLEQAIPPLALYEKREVFPPPFQGSNYAVKPSVTVSNVV